MGRIRTVKPEFFRHEDLHDAEKETGLPLRLAFIGLFTVADREGRFRWRPRVIKLDVMPHDEIDFSAVLDALAARGFLVRYEVGGEEFGCIPTFGKHQVVNMREAKSALPSPDDAHATHVHAPAITGAAHVNARGEGEGEGEREREHKNHIALTRSSGSAEKPAEPDAEIVGQVFEHWQQVMHKPRAQLDDKRRKVIRKALAHYTATDLCLAIDGCKASAWHMGENDKGTKYDTLELILRDAGKIDAFMAMRDAPPPRAKPLTLNEQRAAVMAELTGRNRKPNDDPFTIDA